MRPLSRNCQKKQHWCQTEPWQTSFGTPDGSPTSRLTSFGVHVWVPLNRDEPLKNLPFALLIALVSRWASLQQLGGETHDMSLILSIGCCLEFLANSSRPGRKVDTHTHTSERCTDITSEHPVWNTHPTHAKAAKARATTTGVLHFLQV